MALPDLTINKVAEQVGVKPNPTPTPTPTPSAAAVADTPPRAPLPGEQVVDLSTLANKPDLPTLPKSNYAGNSIVDYLSSVGMPSDFASRNKLASQYGISGYVGSAAQNLQLLGILRGGTPAPASTFDANQFQQGAQTAIKNSNPNESTLNDASAMRATVDTASTPGGATTTTNPATTVPTTTADGKPVPPDVQTQLASLIDQVHQYEAKINSPDFTKSLVDIYNGLRKSAGLDVLEGQQVDLQNIMLGTQTDIKNELTNAGGLVTDSGVAYLTAKRNEVLQNKYDSLTNAINAKKDYIDQVVNLTGLDRKQVEDSFNTQFNLESQLIGLNQTMQQNGATEAKAARDFALANKITKPFYNVAGTVYSTASGLAAHNKAEYQAMGGTGDFSDVQTIKAPPTTQFQQIGTDANGKALYGFVDTANNTIIPYNQPGSGLNNLGQPTGTILGLPAFDTEASNPGVSRPNRNNNPGNIKASAITINYPGVIGVEAKAAADGGNFLIFASAQDGMNAVGQLLQNGKSYQGVSAEAAIKKYSGGGYGAAAVGLDPKTNFQTQISDPETLKKVTDAIAKREGFTGSTTTPGLNNANITLDPLIANTPGLPDYVKYQAQAIINGTQPPPNPSASRASVPTQQLFGLLSKMGFDVGKAYSDWTAQQKYISTLNGSQQVRIRQAVDFAYNSLDLVDSLNQKAEDILHRSGITKISTVQRDLALQGVYGQEAKSAFTQLNNQIADLTSELGTVYKGGNSSTDTSLELAAEQLKSNWDFKTLQDNVKLVRQNLAIRQNSLKNAGVVNLDTVNPTSTSTSDYLNSLGGTTGNPAVDTYLNSLSLP